LRKNAAISWGSLVFTSADAAFRSIFLKTSAAHCRVWKSVHEICRVLTAVIFRVLIIHHTPHGPECVNGQVCRNWDRLTNYQLPTTANKRLLPSVLFNILCLWQINGYLHFSVTSVNVLPEILGKIKEGKMITKLTMKLTA
jgi:hypothetical protein